MQTEQATYAQMVDQARELEWSRCFRSAADWYKAAAEKAPSKLERNWCRAQAGHMRLIVSWRD